MERYNFKLTEKKWQKYWEENKSFVFRENCEKNFYALSMFPYPSGDLHVGHLRNYTILDIVARFKRMRGFNVLHPMGADGFGLPAENAAIKNGVHPEDWTKSNIDKFIESMKNAGLSYDYSRFFATCYPEYYGKQQKLFIDMFKNGLIYQKHSFVNWDPVDQTVLANEQVVDGRGWRSGAVIERKKMKQWFFKVTNYAEELLKDIDDKLSEWPERARLIQKNWIGKSEGALVNFKIVDSNDEISVYTTRPDTLYGASFIGISADHPLARELSVKSIKIANFIDKCHKTPVNEESIETMEKFGIDTGIKVLHPFDSNWHLPVYIANFILSEYGTGAIFACPAHDKRDYDFAKKYNLPIKKVIECDTLPFEEEGIVINSNFLDGLTTKYAKIKAIDKIEQLGIGCRQINYRLHDWGFSRQRYWGCPIPIIYCDKCGVVCLEEKDLPLELPKDVEFTGKGNPLDNHPTWKHVCCPKCGQKALRETDTMDTFVDSSWYFLRYPNLTKDRPFNSEICEQLLPIDQYAGGAEHITMHLMYCRFFTKALRDCGYFDIDEPIKKLFNQGMVCHKAYRGAVTKDWCYPADLVEKDGKYYNRRTDELLTFEGIIKMSKSKSNVVGINNMVDTYGADAVRMFLMSDSPADKDFEWTEDGIEGCWKYINRFYRLVVNFKNTSVDQNMSDAKNMNKNNDIIKNTHKTIKLVTTDLDNLEFNKAIAHIREFTNFLEKIMLKSTEDKEYYAFALTNVIKLFEPFAPHLCSELLEIMQIKDNSWPSYDEKLTVDDTVTIAIQINGKLRSTMVVQKDTDKLDLESLALKDENIKKYITSEVKKVIVVPNKLVNVVI